MMIYSIETRGRIFVKGYGFLSFTKMPAKISQQSAQESATDALKTTSK